LHKVTSLDKRLIVWHCILNSLCKYARFARFYERHHCVFISFVTESSGGLCCENCRTGVP